MPQPGLVARRQSGQHIQPWNLGTQEPTMTETNTLDLEHEILLGVPTGVSASPTPKRNGSSTQSR
jgi:hypothetical protein